MFTNISWSNYTIAIGILLIIWYLIVGLKYYYTDLKKVLSGEQKLSFLHFRKKELTSKLSNESIIQKSISSSFSEPFDTLKDAEELSDRFLLALEESVERNISNEEFQNYLRLVLAEYPYVKISSLREKVNDLMVSECEKHPQLLLTYTQVEMLWEETV